MGACMQCAICTLYTIKCVMFTVQSTLSNAECTECTKQCTLHSVQEVRIVQKCNALWSKHYVHCAVNSENCSVYNVQCGTDQLVRFWLKLTRDLTGSLHLTRPSTEQCTSDVFTTRIMCLTRNIIPRPPNITSRVLNHATSYISRA